MLRPQFAYMLIFQRIASLEAEVKKLNELKLRDTKKDAEREGVGGGGVGRVARVAARRIGVVQRTPPDSHNHTKLRAVPSDSRDLSVMVTPIVEVADGEEVEVLESHGLFVRVYACSRV